MPAQKYGNKKVVVEIDGQQVTFDSKVEYKRYCYLILLEKAGEIQNLTRQPEFILQEGYKRRGKKVAPIKYRADFKYFKNGAEIIEDVKGVKTAAYILKRKILLSRFDGFMFMEVVKQDNRWITKIF